MKTAAAVKKIVIYDVDYTLISVNSLYHFCLFIFKKKPLRLIILPFLFITGLLWVFKIITTTRLKSYFLLLVKGITKEELEKLSKLFIEKKIIPKIKPDAVKNIEEYRKKNYLIIIASASYNFYIKYLAEYLKSDYCFATKIIIKDNKVTTRLNGKNCKGKEKINRILELLPKTLIDRIDSVGYSDELSDLPFLDLVETFFKVKYNSWKIIKSYNSY